MKYQSWVGDGADVKGNTDGNGRLIHACVRKSARRPATFNLQPMRAGRKLQVAGAFFRLCTWLIFVLLATGWLPAGPQPVRVWQGTLELPTYEEGLPDINPPFELFRSRTFITYPYTTRENLTDRKNTRSWRTLNLENEYLKLVVLPDLGGRVYSCVDKVNGQEMFYANPSIKFAQVSFRGAWVALGIEFNFPVSHNWMTVSPVDFATRQNPDGSGTVWVGNTDRAYGMTWRVELTLRPGSSVLEQAVTLYNRAWERHRFYWWNTISVGVGDDSHIIYPMQFTASHGFKDIDTWPVDSSGKDLSIPANHTRGFVSRFAHGSREPFMGVYHPRSDSGVVHYAPIDEVPAKKIWSWGWDDEGRDWRRALSDDESAYVEVQAGLFRNQETYAFLEPQQLLRFHEYYLPVRALGGFSRANRDAILHVRRSDDAKRALKVGLQVTHELRGGKLRILHDGQTVSEDPLNLSPADVFERSYPALSGPGPFTVTVLDASQHALLSHTEGKYDYTPASEVKTGPQAGYRFPPLASRSEGDFVELGKQQELTGRRLAAFVTYGDGLRRFPESFELNKAAGRLAVDLKRFDEAVGKLEKAAWRTSNDSEVLYYLGLAYQALGKERNARERWEGAARLPGHRAPALLQLAGLEARRNNVKAALSFIRQALAETPQIPRAAGLEVALLRLAGKREEAKARLSESLGEDPANAFLRNEAILLGESDPALWNHLAGDPERVLEVVVDYLAIGAYEDALALLERRYPSENVHSEPGTALPQDYPLVSYYRGYCREQLGQSGAADFKLAATKSTRYVFPNRAETERVLQKALEKQPGDGKAHYLLGCLYLSSGQADRAIEEWEQARVLEPALPVLHRNLGQTWLQARRDPGKALSVLQEGFRYDPQNVDLYLAADQCLSLLGRPSEERVRSLETYPNQAGLPPVLVHKLALALVEAGRFDEAEGLFRGRFFPREEFGTNVRQVYLEARLQRALALARAGDREKAGAVAETIDRPVEGLAFTRDGMTPFLRSARFQYYLGEIQELCGNPAKAEEHWRAASDSKNSRQVVFASRAGLKLGQNPSEWRDQLKTALEETEAYVEGGGQMPGQAIWARGAILQELGKSDAAAETFKEALLLPDKGTSHYLVRSMMR